MEFRIPLAVVIALERLEHPIDLEPFAEVRVVHPVGAIPELDLVTVHRPTILRGVLMLDFDYEDEGKDGVIKIEPDDNRASHLHS